MLRAVPRKSVNAGTTTTGAGGMGAFPGRMRGNAVVFVLTLGLYILLDWATFTPAFAPDGIAPWNPPIGLAVAVVLSSGRRFIPLLFIAPLVDDIAIREPPYPWQISAIEAMITGLGYSIVIGYLRRGRQSFEHLSTRDLAQLLGLLSAAALFVALAHSAVLAASGLLFERQFASAALRYWIGEVIGILVVVPFVLFVWLRRWLPPASSELVLQLGSVLLAITIVFGLDGQTRLHFSYALFLPVMWAAVRFGLAGSAAALMLTQNGIMLALHLTGDHPTHAPAFQALMAALAMSGLAIGVLIEERNQMEQRLLGQQVALGRAARLGALGEVTTSIAHELNQPLTAGANFNRITLKAMASDPPDIAGALDAGRQSLLQIGRAAQIIRRLRDFIQVGRLEIAEHDLQQLLHESIALASLRHHGGEVSPQVVIEGKLPKVAADSLQIELVLINLMRNSLEAIEAAGREPHIVVAAQWSGGDFVEVSVRDNGCGFPKDFELSEGASLASSKGDGLGIGLQLCQSIVRVHGGSMALGASSPLGAVVTFVLPVARGDAHG